MSASRVELVTDTAACRSCGTALAIHRTLIDGRPLPHLPVVCDACAAADTAHYPGPPAQDPTDWLHSVGANTRKHGTATLDNFDSAHAPLALHASRQLVEDVLAAGRHDRVTGLYLVGPPGTGKSHLAVAIMRAVHAAKPSLRILYDPADRLIARVQDSYGTGTTDRLIEERRRADLYVLDDLGREKGTDDALRTLSTILDEREGAATVITGNDQPAVLAARYRDDALWARVASRLGDRVYRYVRVSGPDRRFLQSESGGA